MNIEDHPDPGGGVVFQGLSAGVLPRLIGSDLISDGLPVWGVHRETQGGDPPLIMLVLRREIPLVLDGPDAASLGYSRIVPGRPELVRVFGCEGVEECKNLHVAPAIVVIFHLANLLVRFVIIGLVVWEPTYPTASPLRITFGAGACLHYVPGIL